jgi:predicted PurR-regulated permease PerM
VPFSSFFLALFAAFVLNPPVQAVQRKLGVRRGTAVALVVVTILGVVAIGIALALAPLVDAVRSFADGLP